MPNRPDIVECPHCHAQYFISEIFLPKQVFGVPKEIEKDIHGTILYNEGTSPDTVTEYNCDYCGVTFHASVNMSFRTYIDNKYDFSKPYKTKIRKPSLFLSEE